MPSRTPMALSVNCFEKILIHFAQARCEITRREAVPQKDGKRSI